MKSNVHNKIEQGSLSQKADSQAVYLYCCETSRGLATDAPRQVPPMPGKN